MASQDKNETGRLFLTKEELIKQAAPVLNESAAAFASYTFWHYTTMDTALKIIGETEASFLVNSLKEMNDKRDCKDCKHEKSLIHSLCFCNSNHERIPMWYLYSGLLGNGIAIGFTPAVMRDFINSIYEVATIDAQNRKYSCSEDDNSLFIKKSGWVFYSDHDGKEIYCRNKKFKLNGDPIEFARDNFFIKDYEWNYESEFRIVFQNNSGAPMERIRIAIPEIILPRLKFRYAPEVRENEKEAFSKQLEKRIPGVTIQSSDLHISMNLLKRNLDQIAEFIKQLLDS